MTETYRVGERVRVTTDCRVKSIDPLVVEDAAGRFGEPSCLATIERLADPRLAVVKQAMLQPDCRKPGEQYQPFNDAAQRILDALDALAVKEAGR